MKHNSYLLPEKEREKEVQNIKIIVMIMFFGVAGKGKETNEYTQ